MDAPNDLSVSIRSFRPADAGICKTLYYEGLIGGKIAENDTGTDIEDIESAYLKPPGNHFWVVEATDGQVVGMIGVQQHDRGIGEIRRLRVAQSHRRRGIGSALVETALKFCHEQQYLQVKLDTYLDQQAAIKLFEKFRFHHERTKTMGEKQILYFYLDLYSSGKGQSE